PGPAPKRSSLPPAASGLGHMSHEEETVFLEPGRAVDGTLDASESLTTGHDAARDWFWTAAAVAVTLALFAVVFVVVGGSFAIGSVFLQRGEVAAPPEPIPVEATPVKPAPKPPTPAPK